MPERLWSDFLAIRKAKRAPLTQTAIDGIEREAAVAGMSLQQALAMCCERGWQGFRADWAETPKGTQQGRRGRETVAEFNAREAERWLASEEGRTVDV